MNAEQCTDAVMEHLAGRLVTAADAYAGELESEVRRSINVPVGRSGSRIIRSKPGEPPRREFGDYHNSWTHRTTRAGDVITATVGTTSNIGPYLEDGTAYMAARPHAGPAAAQARTDAAGRIKNNL